MRLLIVVYNDLWDACFPLIESLKDKCELFCALELIPEHKNILGITPIDFASGDIIPGNSLNSLEKYKSILPIERTVLIRKHAPRKLYRFVTDSFIECKYINTIAPDFVYFYHDPVYSLVFILSGKNRWGVAVHDPIPHDGGRLVINYLRKIIFKKCHNFFLFSENLVPQFVKSYHLEKDRVFISRLGVYSHLSVLYGMGSMTKTIDSTLHLLFFGKILPYKGLRFLLTAYKTLRDNGVDVDLTIAGRGNIERDIIELSESNGIFINNGFIEEPLLADYIKSSDLVICPYVDATQSGVVMSSFAFCTPVIVTNVGGLSEMVEDRVTGRIVEPSNAKALTNAIMDVVSRPLLIQEWKRNIFNRFYSGEQSRTKIASKLLDDINIIINED